MKALVALLFAIAAAITIPLALYAYNVEGRILSPDAAKALVERAGFYRDLPRLATQTVRQDNPDRFTGNERAVGTFFETLLAPEVLRPFVEHAIDQLTAFARGETEAAVISSAAFKQAMRERVPAALEAATANKPECARGAVRQDNHDWLSCRPTAAEAAQYRERVLARVGSSLAEMPDTFRTPREDRDVQQFEENLPRATRQRLVQAAQWGWLLPLMLLMLMAMLYAQSRRAMAAWVGVPVLIAGLLCLAVTKFVQEAWGAAIAEMRHEATEPGDEFGARVSETIGEALFDPVMLQSAVVAALGAMLVGAAFMMRDEDTTRAWPG